MSGSYYHAKDGLCFKRLDEGKVEVRIYSDDMCKGEPRVIVVDDEMWASIIAAVSQVGDSRDQWSRALAVHNFQEDNLRG